jgi:hypothetical protein
MMFLPLSKTRRAVRAGFFISGLTLASLGAILASASSAMGDRDQPIAQSLAQPVGANLSDRTLEKFGDPRALAAFLHYDPGAAFSEKPDSTKGYEDPPPVTALGVSPQDPQTINLALPDSAEPILPAKPFVFQGTPTDRAFATTCLTQAVYYEAGFEPVDGARAVAQVVLNRLRHPIFPKSVCGVVFQGSHLTTGCQFSFTCDGSLNKTPAPLAWARARQIAEEALNGYVQKGVGEATHYHTQWVVPWWAPTVSKITQIGSQIFYRWPGALGLPGAFHGRYVGNEDPGRITQTVQEQVGQKQIASAPLQIVEVKPTTRILIDHPALILAKADISPQQLTTIKANLPELETFAPRTQAARPYFAPDFVGCRTGSCNH